jgi:hypothetical protein
MINNVLNNDAHMIKHLLRPTYTAKNPPEYILNHCIHVYSRQACCHIGRYNSDLEGLAVGPSLGGCQRELSPLSRPPLRRGHVRIEKEGGPAAGPGGVEGDKTWDRDFSGRHGEYLTHEGRQGNNVNTNAIESNRANAVDETEPARTSREFLHDLAGRVIVRGREDTYVATSDSAGTDLRI